ncbi:MAG: BON domain-containing protein [Acidobacteriota bacterium]|nr:BON domain-containing protein [Acidobacteriota bacterium]
MNRRFLPRAASALLILATAAAPAVLAQNPAPLSQNSAARASQEDTMRVVQEVQKKLAGLSTQSVFDWLTFDIKSGVLTINGFASRPVLKEDAGRAVKNIQGIISVNNQIKVLPYSPNDDRIRAEVYNRIYTQGTLRKYNANQGSLGRAIGPGAGIALAAGGITNTPPLGFHAIHIIVDNGHVSLYGEVLNKTDSQIAGMQANSAPGAFSVDNNLVVQGQSTQPK